MIFQEHDISQIYSFILPVLNIVILHKPCYRSFTEVVCLIFVLDIISFRFKIRDFIGITVIIRSLEKNLKLTIMKVSYRKKKVNRQLDG